MNPADFISNCHVYHERDGVFYIRLTVLEEIHIAGITARKSKHEPDGLWVVMPSYRAGNKFKQYVEFNRNSEFKKIINQLCVQAVDEYTTSGKTSI